MLDKSMNIQRAVADLVVLRGSRIQRPSQEELSNDTSQRPHVDGLAEGEAQDDLWSSGDQQTETSELQV